MTRKAWCFMGLVFCLANSVNAQDRAITGSEIIAMLAGNTAIGEWANDDYRQWFAADGSTIYAAFGKRSTLGAWRISEDGSRYESWWSGQHWEAYSILEREQQFYWVTTKGEELPFEIVEGQQLSWP